MSLITHAIKINNKKISTNKKKIPVNKKITKNKSKVQNKNIEEVVPIEETNTITNKPISYFNDEVNKIIDDQSMIFNKLLELYFIIFTNDDNLFETNVRILLFIKIYLEQNKMSNIDFKAIFIIFNNIKKTFKLKDEICIIDDKFTIIKNISIIDKNKYIKYTYEKFYKNEIVKHLLKLKMISEEAVMMFLENMNNELQYYIVNKQIKIQTIQESNKNEKLNKNINYINNTYKEFIYNILSKIILTEIQKNFINTHLNNVINQIYILYNDLNKDRNFNEEIILIKKLLILIEYDPFFKTISLNELYNICTFIKEINIFKENNKMYFMLIKNNIYYKYIILNEIFYKELLIFIISFKIVLLNMLKNNIINNIDYNNILSNFYSIISHPEVENQYCKIDKKVDLL